MFQRDGRVVTMPVGRAPVHQSIKGQQGAVLIKGLLLHRRFLPPDRIQGVIMIFMINTSPVGMTSTGRVWASVLALLS